jgi:threonine dehydrogenase-like Zn-dependent dehydrogenase
MKAARLYVYDEHMQVDLTLEMVPEPTITAADEVIVRVGAAGLCRTDLHIIEGVWRDAMELCRKFHIPPNYVVDKGVSYVKGCSALDFPFIHDTWPLIYRKISSAISMS